MHVVQTAGEPPKRGRIALAPTSWTSKRRNAPRNAAAAWTTRARAAAGALPASIGGAEARRRRNPARIPATEGSTSSRVSWRAGTRMSETRKTSGNTKGVRIVQRPGRAELEAAAAIVREVAVRTPLVPLHGSEGILLKPEILQPAGSFKIRGIYHAVQRLGGEARRRGLSTVSAGNTAKALAWCARRFGVAARSLMPEGAPKTKVEAVRALGATPVLVPVEEVFRFMREHGWEQQPYAFVHPWTDRDVILGHGSIGLEIAADCPGVETVFVPVGGGGLIAGVASALKAVKPSVRVVAVEPAGCPSFHAARRAGEPVTVECKTICDGVAVPY